MCLAIAWAGTRGITLVAIEVEAGNYLSFKNIIYLTNFKFLKFLSVSLISKAEATTVFAIIWGFSH